MKPRTDPRNTLDTAVGSAVDHLRRGRAALAESVALLDVEPPAGTLLPYTTEAAFEEARRAIAKAVRAVDVAAAALDVDQAAPVDAATATARRDELVARLAAVDIYSTPLDGAALQVWLPGCDEYGRSVFVRQTEPLGSEPSWWFVHVDGDQQPAGGWRLDHLVETLEKLHSSKASREAHRQEPSRWTIDPDLVLIDGRFAYLTRAVTADDGADG